MKTFLFLAAFAGLGLYLLQTRSRTPEAQAIVRVMDQKAEALLRLEHGVADVDRAEYLRALGRIDLTGTPPRFALAWDNYLRVIAAREHSPAPKAPAPELVAAETRLKAAALEAGAKL